MAKSMRSKSKRSFRRTKRETGVYAAAEAARLQRLNEKLVAKVNADKDGDAAMEEEVEEVEARQGEDATMQPGELENAATSTAATEPPRRISTSGPRDNRREEWRRSRGIKPKSRSENNMNKHGVIASSKRAGRSKRRR
ncbi:hypothetical protein RhiJN_04053 [Ceratobasidium sp. AG-Ba]|nr:hypothetical protein RhiJN_04053 [Ceratobasidium sp. AG-Ba]QRW04948.1 hypothetical protein RhiLY_03947 [Ceratobasidium sp. AG-Ba]